MLNILHTGDIHLGDLAGPTKDGANLRRCDTIKCMEAVVYEAMMATPDVTIVAGDLFNRSRVWADTALDDVNDALEGFIRPLCKWSGEVVLLFGTMNHDNPRAFEVIRKATGDLQNLHIYTEPKVETLNTKSGPVQIMAVPGFDKARLRLFCPGVDKETENRNATALINDVILGLSTELKKDIPSVMAAHYTVSGSEADNGSTFLAGQDVVILPSTIDAAGVTLGCFGHIHKPQKLCCNTPAYYCGSVNQLTFNDEGCEHGFWMHQIQDGGRVDTEWKRLPERRHFTLRMSEADVAEFISSGALSLISAVRLALEEAIVRIRYTCTTEQEKAFNRGELQKQIMAAGAFYVAEITPEDIEELDAKDQLTEHDGPSECLARWLEINDITGEKAARLTELALPIIKTADDGRDAGKHTGAFIPKAIEVRNYRSYTEATFDFEPVHMAMVNGQNGVGKSSLFMDAIADCLYEQTRKEEIGGWVRDGTKSGAITFTFGMGGQDYRVIRTRTKSGRGTLALQRFDPIARAWADDSDTTMRLTQERIERLLGMDCNTFCSIALIRQDAYGLFLDADSDRRMEVLSALLGLDVYNRMNDLSRAKAKELRQQVVAAKERVNILSECLVQKAELESEDAALTAQIAEAEKTIKDAETELEVLKGAEALRLEIIKQAQDKEAEFSRISQEKRSKSIECDDLNREYTDTLRMADGLEKAREAAEAVKTARGCIEDLADLVTEHATLSQELITLERKKAADTEKAEQLAFARSGYEDVMRMAPEVDAAKAELEALAANKAELQARITKKTAATNAVTDAKSELDKFLAGSRMNIRAIEMKIERLAAEAEKLADSGCPVPETATCKFLASAVKAKSELPAIREELEATKMKSRAKYEQLNAVLREAVEADAALGDPTAELMELDRKERNLRAKAAGAEAIARATAKIEETDAAILDTNKSIRDAEARISEIDVRLKSDIVMDAVRESAAARRTVAELESVADCLPSCEAASARAEALRPQITALHKDIAYLEARAEAASAEAKEARARIPEADTTTDALRRIVTNYRDKANQAAHDRGVVAAKLEAIAEAEDQITELRGEIEEIAATLNDYTTLGQAFSIDGIPYMIIRGVVPEIMRQSNDILASMTGGRMAVDIRTEREQKSTKQIVNSLEVWINTITGGSRPYQSHSGGEKVKIALAVTLGLADVKARRAGVQLGMLFIDEPPFLDGDGTEAYADALVSMGSRNPNMRILAISHDPTMKARFSQNIIVTGSEDGSTVTMD